jgi:hypothetical protein
MVLKQASSPASIAIEHPLNFACPEWKNFRKHETCLLKELDNLNPALSIICGIKQFAVKVLM